MVALRELASTFQGLKFLSIPPLIHDTCCLRADTGIARNRQLRLLMSTSNDYMCTRFVARQINQQHRYQSSIARTVRNNGINMPSQLHAQSNFNSANPATCLVDAPRTCPCHVEGRASHPAAHICLHRIRCVMLQTSSQSKVLSR